MRRSNNPPAAQPTAADPTVAVSERSCEKSCQVTSEQIKADMKAAAEKKRFCGKEPTSRAGCGKAPACPEVNAHADATRAASAPLTSSVEGVEPSCVGTSRQLPSSRRQSTGATFNHTEDSCKARTRGTRERVEGASQRTAAADMDSQDCGRPAQSGANEKGSGDPPSQQRANYFVPRRPLTRSCTRLSSVSLLPETGKKYTICMQHICCHNNVATSTGTSFGDWSSSPAFSLISASEAVSLGLVLVIHWTDWGFTLVKT